MKLVLDFVPNHTSRNHTWFQQSRQGADNDFSDFYVWYPAAPGSNPPNNWVIIIVTCIKMCFSDKRENNNDKK